MKITFIYAHENEEWSTPMALINEFKSRNWDVDIISIGSNRTGVYTDVELKRWVESNPKTDIVLFMDWGRFDSPYLNKDLVPAFWIQESGDDPQNFERNYPKAARFNLTITPDYESYIEYRKRGINAQWITHFADTRVQFPIDIKPEFVAVTTRGRGGSAFLDQLTDFADGAIGNQNGFGPKEHTEFLNKGLMVIQNSRWGEITRRIFEAMACKKLVITDRLHENKKLHELLIENTDIVFYDSMAECIEKINYYHENADERNTIATNGYQKILNNFTQVQVVDTLLENYYNSSVNMRWDIINSLIKKHGYKSYLEVGAQNTITGNFSKIKVEKKVSIDPYPTGPIDFKGTSDEYFNQLNQDVKFDIIFIDGLHHSDQVLIDIQNSLNHLSPDGTIICHDCLPSTEKMQLREDSGGEWTGDVWKAIATLNVSRDDLRIDVVDTDYGCGVIRRGSNIPYTPTGDYLTYSYYAEHKNELLNVISPKQFIEKYLYTKDKQ